MSKTTFYRILQLLSLVLLSTSPCYAQSAGNALRTIFSPQRSPEKRTMGLLQRSFLDLVEASQGKLEVALVVDGTESMAEDIQSVRSALVRQIPIGLKL